LRQVAAEAMSVDIETVYATNQSDHLTPLSAGSAASRVSLVDPHAVVEAAEDLKRKICAFVASKLDVTPDAIEVADGKAFNRNHPDQAFTMKDIGATANLAEGLIMVGAGAWQQGPVHGHDPVTGELPVESVISFGCCVVEVEVDTETGAVDVNKLVQVWEVGKAINPLLVRQQINGGMQIGLGFALMENMYPYYPEQEITARNLSEYIMPTFMDYPKELIHGIEEVPHPMGVKGAKGFSEGSTSAPPAAIIAAIHDAIGVWIHGIPATPEVILRALEAGENGAKDYCSKEYALG
jgi:CO/xanthine dehydrogenase Mo-binding subunit